MRGLVFDKYEGLGNDFLVVAVDRARGDVFLSPAEIARVCDRNRGVGADGVLELRLPYEGSNAQMIVHNADGSVPEMCGNGLRCVALALVRSHGLPSGATFVVDTDAGPRTCEVQAALVRDAADAGEARESIVKADVGAVKVLVTRELTVLGKTFLLHEATTGNPHAVHFGAVTDDEIEKYGPVIATHPSFPEGVNVGFARLRDAEPNAIDLVVWERGVGRTLACGTGASAAAAIAGSLGMVDPEQPVRVKLPGGELSVGIAHAAENVQMSGPARFVFRGEWSVS